ncbi:heavy-metal-associated domain-containing protein [Nocardia goodfellowii]|uniref:Copper chaperone CopZ n=1 Tax=Nocardia goodfellowii TaxID=882446 RepID=A0ABS4Q958_9NOCA|nr:heavy metal-associated domain-containing protein [Nocardia goodfellowii]MBP2188113.1 copper chaperone CopZ [Nocardia goodfellowii]
MSTAASTATVTVTGMTCGGCANSVRTEVGRIDGVTSVDIDLGSGLVTVDSASPVSREAITAAVAKAGYQVTA